MRVIRHGSARGRGSIRVGLLALAVLTVIALPAQVAGAASPIKVQVDTGKGWTTTGVTVKTGDSITINASGDTHLGPAPIDHTDPNGRPKSACANLIRTEGSTRPFAAPDLDCWSLIGRIGSDKPFQVGSHTSFIATSDGPLLLGVNDNRLEDNTGAWSTSITAPGTGGSSSSNTMIFVIVGLVVLALLIGLFLLARRRRKDDDEPPPIVAAVAAPPEEDVILDEVSPAFAVPAAIVIDEPLMQPAERATGLFANVKVPGPLGTSVAPSEGEVADTNIFEVEIANGTDLRVGYNYFPEDTDLHWQVRQGSLFAHGQFPTNGGGNMYHYVTLPLGIRLEPEPNAVDVQFTWSISGVPFRYSVRRAPGL